MTEEEKERFMKTGSTNSKSNINEVATFSLENGKRYILLNNGIIGEMQEDKKIKIIKLTKEIENRIKELFDESDRINTLETKNSSKDSKLDIAKEDIEYPEI